MSCSACSPSSSVSLRASGEDGGAESLSSRSRLNAPFDSEEDFGPAGDAAAAAAAG